MVVENKLNKLASILLAKAIKDLYPNVLLAESSIDENGFNYSFDCESPISIKELPKILKQMKKNIDRNYTVKYRSVSLMGAKEIFVNQPYKLELIVNQKQVDLIEVGNEFIDICDDLQISKLSVLKSIELTNVAGVYWRGNVKNKQLSNISGMAFDSQAKMDEFKLELQERRERDHRKIGTNLELFSFDDLAGQGLPIWLPKGYSIKHEIDTYIHDLLLRNGYKFVDTPILGSKSLYETSGHWSHYRSNMFPPIDIDGDVQVLRPMTCPHHILIYQMEPRSYRELPFRLAEHAILHRYESSGSLTGLERVRAMHLIDTHIICTPKQIKEVVERCYKIITEASNNFGVKIHSIDLSLHSKDKEKFFDNEKMWTIAEKSLQDVLKDLHIDFKEQIGEAAFYGPKLDLQVQTSLGRIITAYTIQLDFLLPERFKLQYKDEHGILQTPVFVHASVIGTLERFVSILLEQNKGVFPLWLAPIQVAIIPVDINKHGEYCEKILRQLTQNLVRVELDASDERLSKRIRDAQVKKIPYQLIIGDNEIKNHTISYRNYGKQESYEVDFVKFSKMLKEQIENRK